MPHPRAALAAVLIVLFTAACTPDDPPSASATPVAEPVATSSPTGPSPTSSSTAPVVVAPERPAALDDDGVEGAKAAAEYFALLDSYIMKTNDTAVYESMSHKACGTCEARLDQARTIAQNGDTFMGGEKTVRVVHAYLQDEPTGIWPLDVEVTTDDVWITDDQGTEVAAFDRVTYVSHYELALSNGSWVVVGISDLESD